MSVGREKVKRPFQLDPLDAPSQSSSPDLPSDFLAVLRQSRVLSGQDFQKVQAKVRSGHYPSESMALANRLVQRNLLTEYQAQRLLRNKYQGLCVGRYVILNRIGSGSMGRVYRARHVLMDRVVALKFIAPELLSNPRKIARFHREMKLAARLDHPNVVRAFDADQSGDVLYIAMEFVPGQSLGQRLRERGPLSVDEVAYYGAQAALGLAHAHSQGIIHRDIKPSNLFLRQDRQLKVLDFGLAALMEMVETDTAATSEGIAIGTVDYMSPEQACGRDSDGRSDLYSLGCAMYHLLTGRLLFPGKTSAECLAKRVHAQPVELKSLHPDWPPALVAALEKLLAPYPEHRFQSALEAASALESLGPGPVGPSSTSQSAMVPSPFSGSSAVVAMTPGSPNSSSTAIPVVDPQLPSLSQWQRFLWYLSEQPPRRVLAAGGALLAMAGGVGFLLGALIF